ncbi:MAG: DUF1028 domain-containing protein [Alphaproteobacteria bacterium]|nr:DUF1028 domain-containing protein [Alphaproteobacteria bacterium]
MPRPLALLALVSGDAFATWSLAVVDPETGEVGAAAATCGPFVWKTAALAPGAGAVVSLCATRLSARDDAADALAGGLTPEQALALVTDPDEDKDLSVRQFAIAGFAGPPVAFTGEGCDDWQGELLGEGYAAAGNILASEEVLRAATEAYEASHGLPMEERLMRALEAGAAEGGDSRCAPEVAAESAFILIADEEGERVDLTASDKDGAVVALREKLDAGERSNLHCSSAAGGGSSTWLALALLALLRRRRSQGQPQPQPSPRRVQSTT